jgi:hypothetical protein
MGSSASKGARAAGASVRKYPTRTPVSTKRTPAPGPAAAATSPPKAESAQASASRMGGARPEGMWFTKAVDDFL